MTKPKISLILIFAIAFSLVSCRQKGSSEHGVGPSSPRDTIRRIAAPVEAIEAVLMDMRSIIRATGSLEPYQNVRILSKVQGVVEEVHFEQGDMVKKDQVLAVLNKDEYEIALRQAKADLASARAALNIAELERALNQYNRIKDMYEQNLSSKQELEQQRALYLQAKSNFESQEARILSFEANYERARLNLSYTVIRSPMDGIISRRYVQIGELVSPSALIFDMVNISKLYARIHVSEKYIHHLNRGDEVEVRIDAIPDQSFSGTIDIISPVAETASRTFQTSILVNNADMLLKAGMFTRVIINIAEFKDTVAVPKDAIIVRHEDNYCFIVERVEKEEEIKDDPKDEVEEDEEDKDEEQEIKEEFIARLIRVRLGVEDARYIQIVNGVSAGDLVIISGHYELNDGDKVRLIRYMD